MKSSVRKKVWTSTEARIIVSQILLIVSKARVTTGDAAKCTGLCGRIHGKTIPEEGEEILAGSQSV